jgi:cilia- and flagella-associated protein 298
MVKLHIKKGDESSFLYETSVDNETSETLKQVCNIFNGRLKINRLCNEIELLAKSGITLPYNMQGLTDEQISELKLVDEWSEKCVPSGGFIEEKDELGRRNGRAPLYKMKQVLQNTVNDAKEKISKSLVQRDICLTQSKIQEVLDELRGAVTIVYPMGLPPHDPIQMEFNNEEDLEGTSAANEIVPFNNGSLWFSGKEMINGKKLSDFVGKNEKSKVIVKLQKVRFIFILIYLTTNKMLF